MEYLNLGVLICLGMSAFRQEVQFDYDHSVNFKAYQTYQWADCKSEPVEDQLLDRDIRRAVEAQLAGKGLRRVENDGGLLVAYLARISPEKRLDDLGRGGPLVWGPWGDRDNSLVTPGSIEVGSLVVGLFDSATKQLVWRGSASNTLNRKKGLDKNHRKLEKGMAKLFKNYPPRAGKS